MNRESSSLSPPIVSVEAWLSGSGSVVEHLLAKEKVAGSIPVSRSNLFERYASSCSTLSRDVTLRSEGAGCSGFDYGKGRNRLQ